MVLHLEHVEGRLFGNVEEGGILEGALCVGVNRQKGILGVVAQGFVKLVVVLVFELRLGPLPKSRGGIDLLDLFLPLLLSLVPLSLKGSLLVVKEDGKGNVIGVPLDDILDLPSVGVLLSLFVEMADNGGSVFLALRLFDRKPAFPVTGPAKGLVLSGFPADDLYLVGNHE